MAYTEHITLSSCLFLWIISGISATINTSHGKVLCPGFTLPLNTAYQTVRYPSLKDCFIHCVHDDKCRAVSYRKTDGLCYYFNTLADDDCYGLIPDLSVKFFTKISPYKCLNNGTKTTNGRPCQCVNSYVDTWCQRLMRDCEDGRRSGYYTEDKLYTIKPKSYPATLINYCEGNIALVAHNGMDTAAGFFNKSWEQLKYRIGNSYNGYWAGLEILHIMTNLKNYRMILFVKTHFNESTDSTRRYFMNFLTDVRVANETENYKISFSGITDYPGLSNLGGSVAYMNNSQFSTYDRDNDKNSTRHCARIHQAPFWFNSCGDSNPLGTVKKWYNYLEKPERMYFNGVDAHDQLPIDFLMYLVE